MQLRRRSGFTLIELLIVVVIIGILAAIAIPKFSATRTKAAQAALKSDLRNLMTAQESYFGDNATYANSASLTTGANIWAPSAGVTADVVGGTTSYTAVLSSGAISCSMTYIATATATTQNGTPVCN